MTLDEAIARTARRQHGLITIAQLRELGVSRSALRHRLRRRTLERLRRGVYWLPAVPPSQEQAWLTAVLAVDTDVVVSHGSAAAAWELRGFSVPDAIDLLTTGVRPALEGVRSHHTQWLPRRDRTRLRGVPVTSIARTLVDVCGLLPFPQYERAVDDALRRRRLHLPNLVRTFEDIPMSGRRKRWPAERVIAERVPGFNPGGSPAELDVLRILKRAGIHPLPEQQYRVMVEGHEHFLDYAWPQTKQALEYDGVDFHTMVVDVHRDRDRQRRLQRAGWMLWPVTKRTRESEIIALGIHATEIPAS